MLFFKKIAKKIFQLNVYSLLITCLLQLFITASASESTPFKKLKIITSQWNKYTELDGTGLYFEILNETLKKNNYEFTITPWKRAQVSFLKGKYDLILGESGGMDYCQYPKWPIDADFFSALFIKKKLTSWPGKDLLKNQKVTWVRGYNISSFAPKLRSFTEVDSLEQGIKLVLGGRADILIDYDQDIKDYLKAHNLISEDYIVSPTDISGGYIYLCFKKDSIYKQTIDEFDKKMDEMFKNKKLENVFKKYDRLKNYNKIIQIKK